MSFKVTIEETKTVTVYKSQGYELLRKEHATEESFSGIPHDERKEYKRNEDGTYTREIYGWSAKTDVPTTESKKIYEQTVEELDITQVVSVINTKD